MSRIVWTAVLMIAMSLGAVLVPSFPVGAAAMESGVAASFGSYESGLLVRTDGGFRLLVVDPAVVVEGPRQARMGLEQIKPGDRVSYAASRWAGMSLASVVRMGPAGR